MHATCHDQARRPLPLTRAFQPGLKKSPLFFQNMGLAAGAGLILAIVLY